uniref:ARAD1C13310p n=1 Tax=Blastobotrys adeninivorans TaxID=409370 RepID=A0A060T021_BLAAD
MTQALFPQSGKQVKDKCFVYICSKEDERPVELIRSHNVATRVELIVPHRVFSGIEKQLRVNATRYSVKSTLRPFMSDEMLSIIRKEPSFVALSDSRIDHEDVIAIINGALIVSLTKDTYERAGLQGQKSARQKGQRYIVSYNLMDAKFGPGNAGYDRLLWVIDNTLSQEFEFNISCSSESIKGQFPAANSHNVKTDIHHLDDIKVPHSDSDGMQWAGDVYEWLALVSLGSDRLSANDDIDSYLCNYHLDDSSPGSMVRIAWSNVIFTSNFVETLYQTTKSIPGSAINVFGWQDTPIAWNSIEHTFNSTGINNYTLYSHGATTICFKHVNGT